VKRLVVPMLVAAPLLFTCAGDAQDKKKGKAAGPPD
jgi:hypothetical protein